MLLSWRIRQAALQKLSQFCTVNALQMTVILAVHAVNIYIYIYVIFSKELECTAITSLPGSACCFSSDAADLQARTDCWMASLSDCSKHVFESDIDVWAY